MWKKLALLAAVTGTVTQAWHFLTQARTRRAQQHHQPHPQPHPRQARQARQEVQRWENEGGNLPPDAVPRSSPARAKAGTSRPRVRAGTGTASRGSRASATPPP